MKVQDTFTELLKLLEVIVILKLLSLFLATFISYSESQTRDVSKQNKKLQQVLMLINLKLACVMEGFELTHLPYIQPTQGLLE